MAFLTICHSAKLPPVVGRFKEGRPSTSANSEDLKPKMGMKKKPKAGKQNLIK
jgi:hypothetical protein